MAWHSKLNGFRGIKFVGEISNKLPNGLFGINAFFFKLACTPCKAEQPLQGMELQEKKAQKDYSIICLERIYSLKN